MNPIKSLKIKSMINNRTFVNNYFRKLSNNILRKKYCVFKYSYSYLCINNLIFNEKSRIVSRFKDFLLYDDDTEFLLMIYKDELLRKTSLNVFNFYEQFNKAFPNYLILPENKYMYKNLRKKQRMINENNEILLQKQKGEKELNVNLNNSNNKKVDMNFFDDKVKETINRQNNTLLTTSLADTINSNYMNNNDNKKIDSIVDIIDKNSFEESNIISSSISLYSKNSKKCILNNNGNENNDNHYLYNNTKKSLSSLQSFVDCLNNKKLKKIYINNNKNNKYRLLNIDIISNNNKTNNNNYSSTLKNSTRTQNYTIRTPINNQLFKKEKEIKQLCLYNHITLNNDNNNNKIYSHTKITSDIESLSKKKKSKYISKFKKDYSNNVFEKINSSLLGKNKSKQKNQIKKRSEEIRNQVRNSVSRNKVHFARSTDNKGHCQTKDLNNNQDQKIKKVNNYFTFKKIYKNNIDCVKYNKITNTKQQKIEEEINNNNDDNNKDKIYEILEKKFKSTLYRKIRRKKRPVFESDSTESTKLSFNNRKAKYNYYMTNDKINYNSNNQSLIYNNKNKYNKEVLQEQPKEEMAVHNNYNTIDIKTESNIYNHNKYRKKRIIFHNNNNILYDKYKTYYLQNDNNNGNNNNNNGSLYTSVNKNHLMDDNKLIYLDYKLKKIKEEILRNKNNYNEIKEKYRKISLNNNNNKKLLTYSAATSCHTKKYERLSRNSLINSNSVERKFRNNFYRNSVNRNSKNEFVLRMKSKEVKNEKSNNNIHLHQRIFSLMNNVKSPMGRNNKKVLTKDQSSKNKDNSVSNKAEKKMYRKIQNCN